MAQTRELNRDECEELLRGGVVGRVALMTPEGPQIVPVNYSVAKDAIVIRTSPYSLLGRYGRDAEVAFEIDYLDYFERKGWSVVARGRAEAVTEQREIRLIEDESAPEPWAEGHRNLFLRLPWSELTGRRLGPGWAAAGGSGRDRLPQNLHDDLIQRLFATGIQLQALSASPVAPDVAQRIGGAIDELDVIVRGIRGSLMARPN